MLVRGVGEVERFFKLILRSNKCLRERDRERLNSNLNITLPNSVGLDMKMGLHTRISSGCSPYKLRLLHTNSKFRSRLLWDG